VNISRTLITDLSLSALKLKVFIYGVTWWTKFAQIFSFAKKYKKVVNGVFFDLKEYVKI